MKLFIATDTNCGLAGTWTWLVSRTTNPEPEFGLFGVRIEKLTSLPASPGKLEN